MRKDVVEQKFALLQDRATQTVHNRVQITLRLDDRTKKSGGKTVWLFKNVASAQMTNIQKQGKPWRNASACGRTDGVYFARHRQANHRCDQSTIHEKCLFSRASARGGVARVSCYAGKDKAQIASRIRLTKAQDHAKNSARRIVRHTARAESTGSQGRGDGASQPDRVFANAKGERQRYDRGA